MNKIKALFTSPKKTAILGLIGSIILFAIYGYYCFLNIFYLQYYNSLFYIASQFISYLPVISILIYFIIVLLRMYYKKGNIKLANNLLIVSFILQSIWIVFNMVLVYIVSNNIIYLLYDIPHLLLGIANTLFFFRIFKKKKNFVNNKVYTIAMILYSIYCVFTGSSFLSLIRHLCILSKIPYFYNYDKLLGGNKND